MGGNLILLAPLFLHTLITWSIRSKIWNGHQIVWSQNRANGRSTVARKLGFGGWNADFFGSTCLPHSSYLVYPIRNMKRSPIRLIPNRPNNRSIIYKKLGFGWRKADFIGSTFLHTQITWKIRSEILNGHEIVWSQTVPITYLKCSENWVSVVGKLNLLAPRGCHTHITWDIRSEIRKGHQVFWSQIAPLTDPQ